MPFTQVLTTFAAKACYDTILFGEVCDDCNGGAIMAFVALFLRILTVGMVVAGTIGVIWSGALIMTARDSAEQKGRGLKRLYEIVIGLACWALLAGIVSFVLPGGDLNKMMNPDEVVACQLADPPAPPAEQASGGTPSSTVTPSPTPTPTGTNNKPIAPLKTDSTSIPCDSRTQFVQKYTNAHIDGKKVSINLCKVPTIQGKNTVNSRVSGAFYAMGEAYYKATGTHLVGTSAFRSYEDQQYFYNCYINQNCNNGNLAAAPGTSLHEGGLAIDFSISEGSTQNAKVTSCASTPNFGSVTDKNHSPNRWYYSKMSKWMCDNLGTYGLSRPVKSEVWHVNPPSSYY